MLTGKALWRWLWAAVATVLVLVLLANGWVLAATRSQIRTSLDAVEPKPVAVVLGTSKRVAAGRPNLYFNGRMQAAAQLFHAGKVRRLILSGDNRRPDYNEPRDMRDALVAKGLPEAALILDFAGLRTLDTVVRAKEVFGLSRCIIVTDDFHLPRALFLANHFGLEATGFQSPPLGWQASIKTHIREYLARVVLLFDLYVLGTPPKHLGEPVRIPGAA